MGKLTSFTITMETPVVFAGEWMKGCVRVVLSDAMSMKGIYLHVVGKSNTQFKIGKHQRREEQCYINSVIVLKGHGPQESGDNITLPAGTYEFPFSFQLPELVPSSYEDIYGYIRYKLKGIINKPWKFDHSTKQVFTVVGICDLNKLPDAQRPFASQNEVSLRSIKCSSGVLSAWIRTDKKGYVPGEKIYISGEIKNNTSRHISYSKIDLQAMTTFRAQGFEYNDFRKIGKIKRDAVEPGATDSIRNLVMTIPSIPPSYLQGCTLIDIVYYVRLKIKPHLASPMLVSHEIIIGTVPIRTQPGQPRPPMQRHAIPAAPPGANVSAAAIEDVLADFETPGGNVHFDFYGFSGEGAMPSALESYSPPRLASPAKDPPPSYAECVWGPTDTRDDEDNQHTRGQHMWAPSYPFYPSE